MNTAREYIEKCWCRGLLTYKGQIVGGSAFLEIVARENLKSRELTDEEFSLLEKCEYVTHYQGKSAEDARQYRGFSQIAVMRSPQHWWRGLKTPVGAPSYALLKGNSKGKPWREAYLDEISKVDVMEYVREYGEKAVLYCCEKDPKDCHRSVLAEFLALHLNKQIPEIGTATPVQRVVEVQIRDTPPPPKEIKFSFDSGWSKKAEQMSLF
ncbi:MAG: DUF488 family protein [SAR324 cluster bacterium]|nr:DUF488 family protein [SAR324 cluster bacterium]